MNSLKLLVVDDDPVNRTLVSRRLEAMGFQVEVANDGAEGLDKVSQDHFDVIISDLVMPGPVDGLTLLDMCSARRPMPQVILMTAHASVDTAVEAMKKGAADYLQKPINFEELAVRLKKIAVMGSLAKDANDLREAIEATETHAAESMRALEGLVEDARTVCTQAREILADGGGEAESRIEAALQCLAAVV